MSGFENKESSSMNPRLVSSLGTTAMNAHRRASTATAAVSGHRHSHISTALAGEDDSENSSSSDDDDDDDEKHMTYSGRIAQRVHKKAPNLTTLESGKSTSDDSSENWDEFIKSLVSERKPLHTLRSSMRSSIAAAVHDKQSAESEMEMGGGKKKEKEEDTLHVSTASRFSMRISSDDELDETIEFSDSFVSLEGSGIIKVDKDEPLVKEKLQDDTAMNEQELLNNINRFSKIAKPESAEVGSTDSFRMTESLIKALDNAISAPVLEEEEEEDEELETANPPCDGDPNLETAINHVQSPGTEVPPSEISTTHASAIHSNSNGELSSEALSQLALIKRRHPTKSPNASPKEKYVYISLQRLYQS